MPGCGALPFWVVVGARFLDGRRPARPDPSAGGAVGSLGERGSRRCRHDQGRCADCEQHVEGRVGCLHWIGTVE